MNENPFFSIIIPLYNKESFIESTISSVLRQTFNNFELIIVDDGSTDKSISIVRKFNDSKIKLFFQENGGPSKARNRGISEAKGKYIAFLDADDEWLPEKLQLHYEIHNENSDLVWSITSFKTSDGQTLRENNVKLKNIYDNSLYKYINGMTIQTSTVVVNKKIFKDSRFLFNESVKRSEDRELWIKVSCIYKEIGYINQVLTIYKVDFNGLSETGLSDLDFSYLHLPERLKVFLNQVDVDDKRLLESYFNEYNTKKILTLWAWTSIYKENIDQFINHVDGILLKRLTKWNFLPKIIKKLIIKTYLITMKMQKSK